MLCRKIISVMCFFCQQNPAVKLRLVCRYCSDHYGSIILWDLNNRSGEDLCITWHERLRHSCDLPRCTHSLSAPAICRFVPLKYELACRRTCFIDNCLNSVNSVVEFVARNGVYFPRMYSRLLVIQHSFAAYFLRLLYAILEVLIEGWHGNDVVLS